MAKYLIYIEPHNEENEKDVVECIDDQAARIVAMRSLFEALSDSITHGGDEQSLSVFVTDEYARAVYSGMLVFSGSTILHQI